MGFQQLVLKMKFCMYKYCNKRHVNKMCSGCKNAHYCCRTHQKKDWNSKHRYICNN